MGNTDTERTENYSGSNKQMLKQKTKCNKCKVPIDEIEQKKSVYRRVQFLTICAVNSSISSSSNYNKDSVKRNMIQSIK